MTVDHLPRFYRDIAPWWPLISPPDEYTEEAAFAATLLAGNGATGRDVLELGAGGGHMASHLKRDFALFLTDLSPSMLAVSRELNPECSHAQGDMRTLRLGRAFDAVLIHDAIGYMTTPDDLLAALTTAFTHCKPAGTAVIIPDHTSETFEPGTDHGGHDHPDGRGVRYLEWTWDPDPADTWIQSEYSFLLRASDGTVTTAHDTHHTGLFDEATWLRLLTQAGFAPRRIQEQTSDQRTPRTIFTAIRPAP